MEKTQPAITLKTKLLLTFVSSFYILHSAFAFEGRITAALTRGGQATPLLYTAGTNCLRVEVTTPDQPNPVNLLAWPAGDMTLLFPHNRSFVRMKNEGGAGSPQPAGVGPQASSPVAPPSTGPANFPGMPAMPMMPPPMMEPMQLTATGDKTNLLGLACEKFQIKQRGETMEIWATAQLFPFQPYQQNQTPRFGPQMIEEKWGGLLKEKKLFPLLATLKFDGGGERYRFEVKQIQSKKMTDADAKLFLPPPDYQELQPLPF